MQIHRSLWADIRSGDSYALVLGLLLVALVVGIVAPEETWARVLSDAVLATTVVVAYWTTTKWSTFLVPRVVVPSIALVLVVVGVLEGATRQATGAAVGVMLGAGIAVLVARDLRARGKVDVQTVLGALSLFVLVGFVFAFLFALAGAIGGGSFFANGDDGTTAEYLYFSFVTISTTGYGDLTAAGGVARALAVLEIVLGQLYLVTVVAVIVTAATGRELMDEKRSTPGGGPG